MRANARFRGPVRRRQAACSRRPMRPIPASRSAPRSAADDGRVFAGCNVENAAYPVGACAEAGGDRRDGRGGRARDRGDPRRRRRRGARHALRRLPPAHPRVRRARHAGAMSPDRTGMRRSFTLDGAVATSPSDRTICAGSCDGRVPRAPGRQTIAEADRASLRAAAASTAASTAPWCSAPGSAASPTTRRRGQPSLCRDPRLSRRRAVSGHAGPLCIGRHSSGKRVLLFQGRAHYYETGDAAVMRVPLGVARGARRAAADPHQRRRLAAPDMRPGSLVADHRPHQPHRAATRSSATAATAASSP